MISTRFTELVGCTIPIQQAGMGSIATPNLAAAVSNAGGLGMLGTARLGINAETLPGLLNQVASATNRPYGVNFLVSPLHLNGSAVRPPLDLRLIEMAAERARLVEFFYGEPDRRLVDMVHQGGALVCWQVGSRDEAALAVDVGCDLIVAQGVEAGGHVRGTIGLLPLLDAVLEAVNVPVLAAGGIGTARGVAAALAAGADGVRVGTRFIAAAEAEAHPAYVSALINANAEDTVYTEAFSATWPDAPHRVLRSCLEAAKSFEGPVVASCASLNGSRVDIGPFWSSVADSTATGAIEAMSLWAGQSVGAVTKLQQAADIVAELASSVG